MERGEDLGTPKWPCYWPKLLEFMEMIGTVPTAFRRFLPVHFMDGLVVQWCSESPEVERTEPGGDHLTLSVLLASKAALPTYSNPPSSLVARFLDRSIMLHNQVPLVSVSKKAISFKSIAGWNRSIGMMCPFFSSRDDTS